MSRTESSMVQLGTEAPPFELVDAISGKAFSRDDIAAGVWDDDDAQNRSVQGGPTRKHGLLVLFVCPHCPYVQHMEAEIGRLGRDYFGEQGEGPIAIAAIQSNDLIEYPQDGPDAMRDQARRNGWTFPYLLDDTQEIARSYAAACTPDFFLFDGEMRLVYRGQFDSSRPRRGDFGNDVPVSGSDLRAAMDAVIAGRRPDTNQRNSIGCNIKWKSTGSE